MRGTWRIAGFILLIASAARAADKPNVIFIMADDLGYTDLSCYGSKYYETPNIDRMASQGVKFTDGYTCGPNCQPTRAALMSGQYGPKTGVYTVGSIERFNWRTRPLRPVDNVQNLPMVKVTLAEAMRSAGYRTALFGKWHLGQDGAFHPAERGFDEAIVSMGKHFDFVTSPSVDVPPGTYLADFLTDRALDFIKTHKGEPFFLCLHHFGVHAPHEAKPELVERFKKKPVAGGHDSPVYAAMIASVDESVGRVLALLDELKLSENTLVIFTSDNGGVGGYDREGLNRSGGITDNLPLRGGKGMLYEGGVRVPYIFRWKGTIPEGTTSDQPIISVDLYPSMIDLSGAKRPSQPLHGRSWVGVVKDPKSRIDRDAVYWHFPGYLGAGANSWRTTPVGVVRSGDFKLLHFFEDDRTELYNLREDLGEKNNLAAKMPERTKELREKLAAWQKEMEAPMPTAHKPDPAAQPRGARAGRNARGAR